MFLQNQNIHCRIHKSWPLVVRLAAWFFLVNFLAYFTMKMEAGLSYETSVKFYRTTLGHIQKEIYIFTAVRSIIKWKVPPVGRAPPVEKHEVRCPQGHVSAAVHATRGSCPIGGGSELSVSYKRADPPLGFSSALQGPEDSATHILKLQSGALSGFHSPRSVVTLMRHTHTLKPSRYTQTSQSDIATDGQSVSQSHLGPQARFLLQSASCRFVDVGRPLWREDDETQ
jgi:hypothetical protein